MVMHLRLESPFADGTHACRNFVPTREHDAFVDDDMEEASHICNGTYTKVVCPKRHECLIFALINNEHYGMWGGLYPNQRHDLRQRYKRKGRQPVPIEWEFDNATPYEDLLEAEAAREAERQALRSSGDPEGQLQAAR